MTDQPNPNPAPVEQTDDEKRRAIVAAGTKVPEGATTEQTFAVSLLEKALLLHDERAKNTTQTSANREMLRGLVKQELLTDAQKAAVDALYPVPVRKPKTTNGATPAQDAVPGGSAPAPSVPKVDAPAAPPAAKKS